MGSRMVTHPASSVVQRLKMPLILFRHAPCWKLNVENCLATPLGINWIEDIEIQAFCINFLAELKAFRAELIQT